MSEITKLYENAGVKTNKYKLCCTGCKHIAKVEVINGYPTKWICDKYDEVANCDKAEPDYPPFTAEKQLEICKFLLKVEHSISYYFYENRYGFVIDDKQDDCIEAEKFETALAMIVNNLWQDLSEEEKQQVKGILK